MAFPFFRSTALAGLAGLAVVALLTQRPRTDKLSNIADWFGQLGLHHPALNTPQLDDWVGGGLLLVLAVFVFWLTFAPRRTEPRPDAIRKVEPTAPALPEPPAPAPQLPDMPIRELFLLVAPELDQLATSKQRASEVGQVIQAHLAAASLQAWGKADAGARMLYPVETAFWQSAEWTFWFLPADPRNRDLIHATQPDGLVQFRDLHVNRQTVMRLLEG